MERKLREQLKLKKERKTKFQSNNTGITLIALIITIIILLILTSVTINLTLGENGIFKTTEVAGKNYMDAQDKELAGLANFQNTIDNIIGKNSNASSNSTLASKAKPGDYVKYDTGIDSVGDNGIVTFRILYNDDTYGLQIISNKSIETLTLGTTGEDDVEAFKASMNDYNNAIELLNNATNKYIGEYGLDTRCVGSVPTVGTDGKFNAKNTEVEGTYSIPDNYTIPNGWESRDTGCKKDKDNNYEMDFYTLYSLEEFSKVTGILTIEEDYWFASRSVYRNGETEFTFRILYVDSEYGLSSSGNSLCWIANNKSYGESYSLRS